MSARKVLETAVKILEDQLTKTSHIPRFADQNKIRRYHHGQLTAVLTSSNRLSPSFQWESCLESDLVLARVIISDYKKAQ